MNARRTEQQLLLLPYNKIWRELVIVENWIGKV